MAFSLALLVAGGCLRGPARSAATAPAASLPSGRGQVPDPAPKREEFLRGRFVRDIDIAGVVVDQQGNLLDKVKVLVDVAGGRKGHRYERMWTAPDGAFALRYENTIHCYGDFCKEGYYTEEIRFHPHLPVTGVSKDGDALMDQKDIRVVLEEVGPATRLAKYEMRCEFRVEGEWLVKALVAEKADGTRALALVQAEPRVNMGGKTPADLPPHCLYQRADVADGQIVPSGKGVRKSYHGGSESWSGEHDPARVYLGISGPGNGFVFFDPGPEKREGTGQKALRAMKEAPEDGYKQELLLDQTVHDSAFFYIKVGDWYGKGIIGLGTRRPEPTMLDCAYIRVWLQPDGSRNVRSLDGGTL